MRTFRAWAWRRRADNRLGSRSHAGRSFTLLELLVVITILAMAAGVVVVRFGGASGRAAFGQAMARWGQIDQSLRLHARRHNRPAQLRIELGTDRVVRQFESDGDSGSVIQSLGSRVRVARYVSATRQLTSGTVTVDYTPIGTSDSYAVQFVGPGGKTGWLLVAGVTGQVTQLNRDKEVEHVLATLPQQGIHTR